jgi:hypothetical protein
MTEIWDAIAISSNSFNRIRDSKDYINMKAIEESRKLNGRRHSSLGRLLRRIMHSNH